MKILVLGDFMLDQYLYGSTNRISPEAPIPVILIDEAKTIILQGGAGNVANNLASLGCEVIVSDQHKFNTPIKSRLMVGDIQIARWDTKDYCEAYDPRLFKDIEVDRIVVADYAKGSINDDVISTIFKMNLPTFVDTKQDPTPYIGWATAIFPNHIEYEQFKEAYNRFERCIVTRGADGLDVLEFGKTLKNIPAYAQQVVCVNGAGDTVTAAYAARWPRPDAAEFASLAGAVVVSKPMTATCTQLEIKQMRKQVKKNG